MDTKVTDITGFVVFRDWNLNAFLNCWWTAHPEKQAPVGAEGFSLFDRGTEPNGRPTPWCDDDDAWTEERKVNSVTGRGGP
jgi:hypothetical protein